MENTNVFLLNDAITDGEIIEFMQSSRTVDEWNTKRDAVKSLRDMMWIAQRLDSGLIGHLDLKRVHVSRQERVERLMKTNREEFLEKISVGDQDLKTWYRQQLHIRNLFK